MENRIYLCIDLKSFYASVECASRNLDPLNTNLVVADASRTSKTICLAVSPSLKKHGISSRARLFEVEKAVIDINRKRITKNPAHRFSGESVLDDELEKDPTLKLGFLIAPPQMAKYMEISSQIYNIYLKYVSSQDIHVYSIDEVFIDLTAYLNTYNCTANEFARMLINEVYEETSITATAGLGTNLYLAKIAMDIVAKHVEPDENGARIAYLDEMMYRHQLWNHKPLKDFWRIGRGINKKLNDYGMYTMGDIALCSLGKENEYYNEDLLYKLFGINAELLIDHAWGYEPTRIEDIKNYKPSSKSISSGQVLPRPYNYQQTAIIVKEMCELVALDLVNKHYLTNQLGLTVIYDIENLNNDAAMADYQGEVSEDYYGRQAPKQAFGSINLPNYSAISSQLTNAIMELFKKIVNPKFTTRKIYIVANNLISGDESKEQQAFQQLDLFSNQSEVYDEQKRKKEEKIQKAILKIKDKYGKNAIMKGMNLQEGATTLERNKEIGGHKA